MYLELGHIIQGRVAQRLSVRDNYYPVIEYCGYRLVGLTPTLTDVLMLPNLSLFVFRTLFILICIFSSFSFF